MERASEDAYRAIAATPPPESWRIDDLVWRMAATNPDSPAIVSDDQTINYRELASRADRTAAHLRERGVLEGDQVAVLMERSPELLVTIVGILRAGACCLPLAPTDPAPRIERMVATASAATMITSESLRDRLPGGSGSVRQLLSVDELAEPPRSAWRTTRGWGDATGPAFAIGTSGSTGRPKVVSLSHANYTSHIGWVSHNLRLSSEDVTLCKAPVSFVSMLRQVVWPLAVGASIVVVPPGREFDVPYLCQLIDDYGVTFTTFVSPALDSFLRHARLNGRSVANVVSGGDRFPPGMVRRFFDVFPGARLHQTYGLTEAILISCSLITGPDGDEASLGTVIPGSTALVLDERREPVPVGSPGDLYVGGFGLTAGYIGQPELDAERFLVKPSLAAERLLLTRDRARLRRDGSLELLGRADHVVKVRGFLVALAEIEAALNLHPAIAHAACYGEADPRGDTTIAAYVVLKPQGRVSGKGIRQFLGGILPDYMVPVRYVRAAALPLTENGKVDRGRLPGLASRSPASDERGSSGANPAQPLEGEALTGRILTAWFEVLPAGAPADQDFQAAGGTSLTAMDLASKLTAILGFEVPPTLVLDHPTLAEFTSAVVALGDVAQSASGAT